MSDTDGAEDQPEFQVFVKGDRIKEPVQFFLHRSLTLDQQEKLERDIENNGGVICEDEREADTILVHRESFDMVKARFSHSKKTYVEMPDFIKRCLHRKEYYHDKPIKKSKGGHKSGTQRRAFIAQDDVHLAEYLASRIPDKAHGGRKGNGVYIELRDGIHKDEYPWAERHPWQSWRGRYKNNEDHFDEMINEYLLRNPPRPDGMGEYPHDERAVGLGNRRRTRGHQYLENNKRRKSDEESDEGRDRSGEEAADNTDEVHERRAEGRVPRRKSQRRMSATRARDVSVNSDRGGKRKKAIASDTGSPSTPEQARQRQRQWHEPARKAANAATGKTKNILDENDLIRFDQDDDDFFAPDFEHFGLQIGSSPPREAGPSNTQATLVATQIEYRSATKANGPIEAPPSSMPSTERRMAARNRKRSASARSGATGRTIVPPSPPKDTQAIVIATQTNAELSSQPQARQRRLVSNSVPVNAAPSRRSPSVDEPIDVGRAGSQRRVRGQQGPRFTTTNVNNIEDIIIAENSRPSKQRQDVVRKETSKLASAERSASQGVANSHPPLPPAPASAPTLASSAKAQQPRVRLATQRTNPAAAALAAPQSLSGRGDAPYRNTRARSRSVEPQMMPPPPLPASNPGRRRAAMQAVEGREEENAGPEGDINMADTEEFDDQHSIDMVEDTLAIVGEEEEEEEEEEEGENEGEDDDDDDEGEEEEEADEQASDSDAESEPNAYIVEEAKRIKERRLNTVDRTPQLRRPFRASLSVNREVLPSSQPRLKATPRRQESTESDFPTAGTRAKEARTRQEQVEKGEPYTPTPGSRAEGARAVREQAQMGRPERLSRRANL